MPRRSDNVLVASCPRRDVPDDSIYNTCLLLQHFLLTLVPCFLHIPSFTTIDLDTPQYCNIDKDLVYTINILPALPLAMTKIHAMAGYEVFGMNVDPALCITKFVTDAFKPHHKMMWQYWHGGLFEFMDDG